MVYRSFGVDGLQLSVGGGRRSRFEVEGFMGPFLIEDLAEGVEAALLSSEVVFGGPDGFERARAFYGHVFDWSFDSWGPPGFYLIKTGSEVDRYLRGALQQRTEPLEGQGTLGFECSIAVESVDTVSRLVEEHGGTVVLSKSPIPGIGWVVKFRDTEGNDVSAVEYHREGR